MRWSCCSVKVPYEAAKLRGIFFFTSFLKSTSHSHQSRPSILASAPAAPYSPDSHPPSHTSQTHRHTFPFVFRSTPSFFLCIVKGWLLICNSKESNDSLDYSTFQGKVSHAFCRHSDPCYEIPSICGTYSSYRHVLCKNRGLEFPPCTGTRAERGFILKLHVFIEWKMPSLHNFENLVCYPLALTQPCGVRSMF